VISPDSRSEVRPGFEAIYAHYAEIKGLDASWSMAYRDYVNENLDDNAREAEATIAQILAGSTVSGTAPCSTACRATAVV
jgi:hypothetical protein